MTSEEFNTQLRNLIYESTGKQVGGEIILAYIYADKSGGGSYLQGDVEALAKLITALLKNNEDLQAKVVLNLLKH